MKKMLLPQQSFKFIQYIKSKKYFLVALFLIIVAGIGSIAYINRSSTKEKIVETTNTAKTAKKPSVTATLSTIEGTVQLSRDNNSWTNGSANQTLALNTAVKTLPNSKAIISFSTGDWLALDQTSLVILKNLEPSKITIEQTYGKTYNSVVTNSNKIYSINKGLTKATAMGTEFMVTIPETSATMEIFAYKNRVRFEYDNKVNEILELNKGSYTFATKQYITAALSNEEKEQNKSFLTFKETGKSSTNTTSTDTTTPKAETAPASTPQNNDSSDSSSDNAISTEEGNTADTATPSSQPAAPSPETPKNDSPSSTPLPTIFGNFSNDSIEDIANSLQLVYDDVTGDFTTPPGGAPPQGVYDYAPIDLDNLYMGVRNERLYIKWTLNGTLPSSRQTIGNDTINSISFNIAIDTDNNPSNSWLGAEIQIQSNIGYHEDGQIWYNSWYKSGWLSGDTEASLSYQNSGNGTVHTYNSGIGKTSIVYSYPLSGLGISVGDTVKLDIWSEAESNNWSHYSCDLNYGSDNNPLWKEWTVSGI